MTEHPSPDQILRIVKDILKHLRSTEGYRTLAHAIECPHCRSTLLEGLVGRPGELPGGTGPSPPADGSAEPTSHDP